jgi:glutamate/tyrosine decarboxylase-like PLP-dependent enzyme
MATDLTQALTHPVALARLRERIAVTTEAARRAGGYLASAPHRPIAPTADAVAALEAFRRPLQDGARTAHDVLRELDEVGSPATTIQAMGRYFGYVNGGVEPAAAGASILAGAWDHNAALPVQSPVAAVLDEVAANWIVDLLDLPADAVATFTTGATMANFTAIVAARDALLSRAGWDVNARGIFGAPAIRVIVGDEVHISALKSLRLAGFAPESVERVPVDNRGAIDADAFPTDTDELTLVLLQAGNVTTGASDPFARIIPGVRERGGWVHVDGAFGLWAAASPTLRDQVAGVELADSWATDAHKWLNAPYDSGVVIVRDQADLYRAMAMHAPYLASTDARQLMHLSPHMSQRARGVETWALLAARGRSGIADLVDHSCAMATLFADLLSEAGVEVLVPPTLNQVPVAFGPSAGAAGEDRITVAVTEAIQREGTLWAGGSAWRGRSILRISVSDSATTADDVHASVDAVVASWQRIIADV